MGLFTSDTRLSFVSKNKFRKILFHSGYDPGIIKKVKCVVVFQKNDIIEDSIKNVMLEDSINNITEDKEGV